MLAKRIVYFLKYIVACLDVHDGKAVNIGIAVQFRSVEIKELVQC